MVKGPGGGLHSMAGKDALVGKKGKTARAMKALQAYSFTVYKEGWCKAGLAEQAPQARDLV